MGKLCFALFAVLLVNSASLLVFCEDTITRNDFPYPPHCLRVRNLCLSGTDRMQEDIFLQFYWSFMDRVIRWFGHVEWYGLYYVDVNDNDLKRYPKLSAHWYSKGKENELNSATEVEKTTPSLLQSHSSQSILLCLKYESIITLFQPSFSKAYANYTDHPF